MCLRCSAFHIWFYYGRLVFRDVNPKLSYSNQEIYKVQFRLGLVTRFQGILAVKCRLVSTLVCPKKM